MSAAISTPTVLNALRRLRERASNPNIKTYVGLVFIRRIEQSKSGVYKINVAIFKAGYRKEVRCEGRNLTYEESKVRIRELKSKYSQYEVKEVTDSYE